ncbi:phasin family protein [Albibacillus kandeliae]|uniref:phasin family protein n=1 Tax=Albibacillus kandeliae TaxID=2174228 RepID=UPI000D690023|nr:phasin family protein [Albibacillus kandeliae]
MAKAVVTTELPDVTQPEVEPVAKVEVAAGAPEAEKVVSIKWDLSKWMPRDMMDAWLEIGNEIQTFVTERLHDDVETQHKLLHCTTPGEALHIQTEFCQRAMSDYRAEMGKLYEMSRTLMSPAA